MSKRFIHIVSFASAMAILMLSTMLFLGLSVRFAYAEPSSPDAPPGGTSGDSPPTAQTSFTGSYGVIVSVHAHGKGLGEVDPSGSFTVSGIPTTATVSAAYVYLSGYYGGSADSASLTFASVYIGSKTPDVVDPGGSLYFKTWIFDVTVYVTGDGTYSYSTSGISGSCGSALVVVFTDTGLPSREIIINSGMESLESASSTTTFTRSPGGVAGAGTLYIFEMAGDADGTGEEIKFNGATVLGPGDIFNENIISGKATSLNVVSVSTIAGVNTATVATGDDWIGWILAILDAPYQAPEGVPEFVDISFAASLGLLVIAARLVISRRRDKGPHPGLN
jgi:hypothetical protein